MIVNAIGCARSACSANDRRVQTLQHPDYVFFHGKRTKKPDISFIHKPFVEPPHTPRVFLPTIKLSASANFDCGPVFFSSLFFSLMRLQSEINMFWSMDDHEYSPLTWPRKTGGEETREERRGEERRQMGRRLRWIARTGWKRKRWGGECGASLDTVMDANEPFYVCIQSWVFSYLFGFTCK